MLWNINLAATHNIKNAIMLPMTIPKIAPALRPSPFSGDV